jgi:medium-chain acyl-[acyl-carrier-protein] hydrolase
MEQAVEEIAAALTAALDVPYALFGDCTGALVALELCRSLRRLRVPAPRHLFVACCRAPHLPLRRIPVHTLDDHGMKEELRRFGLAPAWLLDNDEYSRAFLPMLRDDFELAEAYSYASDDALGIPITAFAGTDDPITDIDEVRAWRLHTWAQFEVKVINGGHDLTKTHEVRVIDEVVRALHREIAHELGAIT